MNKGKAGVGFADHPDSYEAGRRAAQQAIDHANRHEGGLVFAFCSGRHDYDDCFRGLKSVLGDRPVIGGAAIGVITNDRLGYSGHQVAAAVLPESLDYRLASTNALNNGERASGLNLGSRLADNTNNDSAMTFVMYDSIKEGRGTSLDLNVSTYLLDGLVEGLGDKASSIAGAGLIGSYTFDQGKVFCGDHAAAQSAVAASFSGNVSIYTKIMHGCKPMSNYHTITRVEGPVVYEIDGQPALDVVDELLGSSEWQNRLPLLLVTLGVNHGDKFAPYNEADYVNRLVLGIIPEQKALVLFEADFKNGDEFQFMRRSEPLMIESADRGSREMLELLESNKEEAFFALYVDCAGRAAGFTGADEEEAAVIQKNLSPDIPLLGFYSGVEIAPFKGKARGLDWTGVLHIFARSKA